MRFSRHARGIARSRSIAIGRAFAILFALGAAERTAHAQEAKDGARRTDSGGERLTAAAEEYDLGRRAYLAGKFEDAAEHFENAFHDAPRPEPLRSAIRARRAAHDDARAATLASLAAVRYATDAPTMDLANETMSELSPRLLAVSLACTPDCGVAADGHLVSVFEGKQHVFYVAPGKHEIVASWSGDRSQRAIVEGPAGKSRDLSLTAPAIAIAPLSSDASSPARDASPVDASPAHRKPLGPAVFIVGASLTAIGIGAVIASGIAAENDPGKDAVMRDCVGQGTSCPTYQRGKSAELRTDVILGATGGVAIATAVIGVFFTQWTRTSSTSSAKSTIAPFAEIGARSSALGVRGSF